ncbi:MAG: helix-turn-helix domain-containing protein [Patescibacteria group bacterium]|nr:hypothetical protein [Patescibacteria group bacterium]
MKEVNDFLRQLGLSSDEVEVYLYLLKNGKQSVLNLSRGVRISRTTIYRICEALREKGLVEKLKVNEAVKYRINNISSLEKLVSEEEKKVKLLGYGFKSIESILKSQSLTNTQKIKVTHYSGSEEVKQLIWNTLNARNGTIGLGYYSISEIIGTDFMVRWWKEMIKRGLTDTQLFNPVPSDRVRTQTKNENFQKEIDENHRYRIIERDILEISYDSFIYNDVFSIVQWLKDECYGLEIQNKIVADQERELFNFFWKMAKPDKLSLKMRQS